MLASLCGHENIVRYLLNNGAVCDRDTFQGARCMYASLTDKIRGILLEFDISKAIDTTRPFAAHISSLLTRDPPSTSDISLRIVNSISINDSDTKILNLHKFILSARCRKFCQKFENDQQWRTQKTIDFPYDFDHRLIEFVIEYLYLNPIPTYYRNISISSLETLLEKLELPSLQTINGGIIPSQIQLDPIERVRYKRISQENQLEVAKNEIGTFLNEKVFGHKLVIPISQTQANDTKEEEYDDYGYDDENPLEPLTISEREFLEEGNGFPDVIVYIKQKDSVVYYPVHRAMLIKSEYFNAMLSFQEASSYGDENETNQRKTLPVISLQVSTTDVGELLLNYLYVDKVDIPGPLALDVLYAADLLLIDRLKSVAAIAITTLGYEKVASLYEILRAGWHTRVNRLENYVAEQFANNLKFFIYDEEFSAIILESANRIAVREETDTIELIDDIRFFLEKKYGPYEELQLIHKLLKKLGLKSYTLEKRNDSET